MKNVKVLIAELLLKVVFKLLPDNPKKLSLERLIPLYLDNKVPKDRLMVFPDDYTMEFRNKKQEQEDHKLATVVINTNTSKVVKNDYGPVGSIIPKDRLEQLLNSMQGIRGILKDKYHVSSASHIMKELRKISNILKLHK